MKALTTTKRMLSLIALGLLCAFVSRSGHAESIDQALQAAENARSEYIQRFEQFTTDKNVMGQAKSPDGTPRQGEQGRLNNDDKNPFASDLTYHDDAYDKTEVIEEEDQGNGVKKETSRDLPAFISEHGKVTAAGGSSILERTMYEQHEKYSKEKEEKRKNGQLQQDPGIKDRGAFDKIVKEVKREQKDSGGSIINLSSNNDDRTENIEVDRWQMKDAVKQEIEKVGSDSFETVREAGTAEANRREAGATPNLLFLYEGAKRALKAMYNSTLSNVSQYRVADKIDNLNVGDRSKPFALNESYSSCDTYEQQAYAEIDAAAAKASSSPDAQKRIERLREQVRVKVEQCRELSQIDFRRVNPEYQADEEGRQQLVEGGSDNEDGRERDLRVQADTLAGAGKAASESENNWGYDENDDRALVTLSYNEDGTPNRQEELTVKEQIELYNDSLREAVQGYEEVQSRLPEFEINTQAPLQFVKPTDGEMPTWEISKVPDVQYQENFGVQSAPNTPGPQTYDQLVQSPE